MAIQKIGFACLKLALFLSLGSHIFIIAGDDVIADLQAVHSSMETLLRDSEQNQTSTQLGTRVNQFLEEHEELIKLENDLIRRTLALKDKIKAVNSRQIQFLSQQLEESVTSELESRKAKAAEKESIVEEDYSKSLSVEEFNEEFTVPVETVIKDVNDALQNWVVDRVGHYAMETRIKKAREVIATATEYKASITKKNETKSNTKSDIDIPTCVSPADGAYMIHKALSSKPKEDYLAGATIVHEFTSETYSSVHQELLGKSPLRRYIPDDVERILPDEWEEWNVAVPSSVYRFLNMPHKAKTLPPEAILDASLHPGACWPMAGSSGFVTIRLSEPVAIESITINHAPVLKSDRSSAPKNIKLIGYPPCRINNNCGGLGFDIEQPNELMQIRYDIGDPPSQKFPLEAHGGGGGGSCSGGIDVEEHIKEPVEVTIEANGDMTGEIPQCSQPPPVEEDETEMVVAAIRLEFTKNWGNQDYTCIYQLKMHGIPV
mmetsp:Transcript_27435/g.31307  ORF Transcript_27435/g.31307 Transcript_27435/m.31307 type:complete len:490 (+) Transcript_27435:47-1516(+)